MHAAMFQHDAAPHGQNYAFYLWFETELWADAVVRFERRPLLLSRKGPRQPPARVRVRGHQDCRVGDARALRLRRRGQLDARLDVLASLKAVLR